MVEMNTSNLQYFTNISLNEINKLVVGLYVVFRDSKVSSVVRILAGHSARDFTFPLFINFTLRGSDHPQLLRSRQVSLLTAPDFKIQRLVSMKDEATKNLYP